MYFRQNDGLSYSKQTQCTRFNFWQQHANIVLNLFMLTIRSNLLHALPQFWERCKHEFLFWMLFNLLRTSSLSTSPRQCHQHEDLSVFSSNPWAGEGCLAPYYKMMTILQLMKNCQRQQLYRSQLLTPPLTFYHDPSVFSLWHLFLKAVMHNKSKYIVFLKQYYSTDKS